MTFVPKPVESHHHHRTSKASGGAAGAGAGDGTATSAENKDHAEPVTECVAASDVRVCNASLVANDADAAAAAAADQDDLTSLVHLHEPAILRVLQLRCVHNIPA